MIVHLSFNSHKNLKSRIVYYFCFKMKKIYEFNPKPSENRSYMTMKKIYIFVADINQ